MRAVQKSTRKRATGVARPRQCSPPLHRQPAEVRAGVNDQELAGDVAGAGEEEDHRFRHLLRRAGLAQRRGLLLGITQLLGTDSS